MPQNALFGLVVVTCWRRHRGLIVDGVVTTIYFCSKVSSCQLSVFYDDLGNFKQISTSQKLFYHNKYTTFPPIMKLAD